MKLPAKATLLDFIKKSAALYTSYALTALCLLLLFNCISLLFQINTHTLPNSFFSLLMATWLNDALFWLSTGIIGFIPFCILNWFLPKFTPAIAKIFIGLLILIHTCLFLYFNTAMNLLGADLFSYSVADIKQTLSASNGLNLTSIVLLLIAVVICITALKYIPKLFVFKKLPVIYLALSAIIGITTYFTAINTYKLDNLYAEQTVTNKSAYFYGEAYHYFFAPATKKHTSDIYSDTYAGINTLENTIASVTYINPEEYPFYHTNNTKDVLSSYFNTSKQNPSIVIVVVEGLGSAFSNKNAYLGSFTPFLDSLAGKSLYWKNCLSSGGRTFAVLPSLLGSLPFGKNGFLELEPNAPNHLSLLSLLHNNHYTTSFFYGGDATFDNMKAFLQQNKTDIIVDKNNFSTKEGLLPAVGDFSWGYDDEALYTEYFKTKKSANNTPRLDVLLTVSSHNPFKINNQEKYYKLFYKRLKELSIDKEEQKKYIEYKDEYASILYTDAMLQKFFKQYAKNENFNNTIFIITGDHRMPEIPMTTVLDRYQVPLIIYSPLLKTNAHFASISSHFDVTPSLLAYLQNSYNIKVPNTNSFVGTGLDTTKVFRNIHKIPLMQTKVLLQDYIMGSYFIHDKDLYTITENMELVTNNNTDTKQNVEASFDEFKQKNEQLLSGKKIVPDSIYAHY